MESVNNKIKNLICQEYKEFFTPTNKKKTLFTNTLKTFTKIDHRVSKKNPENAIKTRDHEGLHCLITILLNLKLIFKR